MSVHPFHLCSFALGQEPLRAARPPAPRASPVRIDPNPAPDVAHDDRCAGDASHRVEPQRWRRAAQESPGSRNDF